MFYSTDHQKKLNKTLISYNGPWLTFPFVCTFDDITMTSPGCRGISLTVFEKKN